jgi:hypothetical protein
MMLGHRTPQTWVYTQINNGVLFLETDGTLLHWTFAAFGMEGYASPEFQRLPH